MYMHMYMYIHVVTYMYNVYVGTVKENKLLYIVVLSLFCVNSLQLKQVRSNCRVRVVRSSGAHSSNCPDSPLTDHPITGVDCSR